MGGWPSDTWLLATIECLRWSWKNEDERQEVLLALYCAWPDWQPERGSWLSWAGRYVRWWLKGVRRRERKWTRQTTMEAAGEVKEGFKPESSACGCGGKLFSLGLCQRCYRRKRRRGGKVG
jgi:hypothetical protein